MKVELEGFKELEDLLLGMGEEVSRSTKDATENGAKIADKHISQMAPRSDAIGYKVEKVENHRVTYLIGLVKKFWYLQFLETGAQPHEITGNPMIFEGAAGTVVTKKVQHTGMAAQPFLKPGFRKAKKAIPEEMGKVFLKAILKFVR